MTALVNLDSVSAQVGSRMLFHELRLSIPVRARIGIVGPNGSGKSTLLKILAGQLEPSQGRVVSGETRVSYLPQFEHFENRETVLEAAVSRLRGKVLQSEEQVAASKSLSRVGFSDFSQQVGTLSGGWQRRLSTAIALAQEPDLLLLDEPTNHLDLTGLQWLENLLQTSSFGWVLVSHDRYFLNQTVERIIELSSIYSSGFFATDGGYLEFQEKRREYLQQVAKQTSSLANKARRELDWASRSPKARTGKAAFRLREAKRLQAELREAKARRPKESQITSFRSSDTTAKELVELIKCSFSYGERTVIDRLSYVVRNQSCLGLLGENGQGKSTLLRLIGGELQPSSGKVKSVHGLRVVYFDQLRQALSNWRTLGELIGEGHQEVVYQEKLVHVVSWGKRFGFELADHEKSVSTLSGGERARALLSLLVRQEADLLLLDEPTNDLDIPMLEALETMILEFPGAVVLVSHDRYMLDEVCTTFLGFLPDGSIKEFASFEQWGAERKSYRLSEPSAPKALGLEREKGPQRKLSYKDQLEYGRIEGHIEKAEERLAHAEERAADPESHAHPEKSREISQELAAAQEEVDRLYARWEELDSLKRKLSR